MFPSNPNVPHDLPSSSNHIFPLDSFANHEKYDLPFNYLQMNDHPYEFLFHGYNNTVAGLPPPPIMPNGVATINLDFVTQPQKLSERSGLQYCEDSHDDGLLDSVVSSYKKKIGTSKKEGNRKINTARGPKDRRVRLSTEIARKFFSLQDFLGFERASKTVDWLLTNSVTAIKELVEESNHDSSDQSNLKFLESIINGGSDENINGGKNKSVVKWDEGKKKKTKRKREVASFRGNNVARDQSRAEARARARERTREKMRVKELDDNSKPTL